MIAKNLYMYLSALAGAAALMLLRICDQAGALSMTLAILGMSALLYAVRHASSGKEWIGLAGIIAVTYTVRFYGYTGSPVPDLLLGFLTGLILSALLFAERLWKKQEDCFLYTLIFPTVYLLFLYFTELVKINMPFRLDTYCASFTLLTQITALFGIYILDFLIAWAASVLVFCIDSGKLRQKLMAGGVYAAVLCGVFGYGAVHLKQMNAWESAKTDTVRVACTAGPYYGSFSDASYDGFTLEKTLASFRGIVADAAEQNTEILVFCEEAYSVKDTEEGQFLAEAEKEAAENGMHILLAYEVEDTDDSEEGKCINKLCWISNTGEVLYDYVKHCIIPVIETSGYVRGEQMIEAFPIEVHGKTLTAATAICYDADFDFFMAHMGKKIDLLLLPTWDWDVIAEEHFNVARLRAIASETTLVRSVYDGWNAVIDSTGKVWMRENTNQTGYENVLVYDVPVQ